MSFALAPHNISMKITSLLVSILALAACALHADFLSPFADSPIGATATSHGLIRKIVAPDGGTGYFVKFATDTGPRELGAEIPSRLADRLILGSRVKITATIRVRDAATGKSKERYLEVTDIQAAK